MKEAPHRFKTVLAQEEELERDMLKWQVERLNTELQDLTRRMLDLYHDLEKGHTVRLFIDYPHGHNISIPIRAVGSPAGEGELSPDESKDART